PEQIWPALRGSGVIDARADLFALGAILFEAPCGRPPPRLRTPNERDMARLPDEVRGHVPAALATLCERLLTTHVADRPGHAEDVARALAGIMGRAALGTGPERPVLFAPG